MNGKLIFITGATSGIGKAAVFLLATDGYRIVFTSRDVSKAGKTKDELTEKTGNQDIHFIIGDLSNGAGVKKIADEFLSRFDRLDILVNNAGEYFHTRKITGDGYENAFSLNHLGYFRLTLPLIEIMKKSATARIINVSSEASRAGHINFDDLMLEKKYDGIKSYCQSKLANLLFTYELSRRLKGTGITVNAMHPGSVRTNFGNDARGIYRFFFNLYIPFMRKPEKGAETLVYLVRSEEVESITGKYFYNKKELKSVKESYDEEIARRLWEKSLELTNLGNYDIK